MNNNVIVTGGAGYIGSMTAKILKHNGYNPVVVDNLKTGFNNMVKFGPFEKSDIGNIDNMKHIFNKYNPVSVIHFAASTSVGESVADPFKYYNNNTVKTVNLLKAMLDSNIHNIVFSSTAALFGNSETSLVKEDDPINPINPYGRSKAMVEEILSDFDNAYNMKFATLRYFNVVGADPELEVGECKTPGLNLFPIIFERATKNQDILIYGNDYNTKDGTGVRDYIHVKDLAVAHVLAMEKLLDSKKSFKVNLGNGKGFSVQEIIDAARKVMKRDFNAKVTPRREGDPATLISDISFSRKYLNWHPEFKDVETSLTHAWLWFKKYNNL